MVERCHPSASRRRPGPDPLHRAGAQELQAEPEIGIPRHARAVPLFQERGARCREDRHAALCAFQREHAEPGRKAQPGHCATKVRGAIGAHEAEHPEDLPCLAPEGCRRLVHP